MKLFELIKEIKDRVDSCESLEDVIKHYPINKSPLPYLFTLLEEVIPLMNDFEHKNAELQRSLDDLNELLELSDKGFSPELERVKNEKKELEQRLSSAYEDYNRLASEILSLKEFLSASFIGRYLLSKWELSNG